MTQEVQIVLTMEFNANRSKESIEKMFKDMLGDDVSIQVKEEAEIYSVEDLVPLTDKAMKSAAMDILRVMPEDSWHITCKHLPDYDHRDEILWSNQMQKILDNEMEEEEEIQRYLQESGRETGSIAGIELSLRILDLELYLESRDNLDRDRLETDTFFLQEIMNDLIKHNGPHSKGMEMMGDWLSELKKKSGYFDNEFFVKRFKEIFGEENWDQDGYEQYIQRTSCHKGK